MLDPEKYQCRGCYRYMFAPDVQWSSDVWGILLEEYIYDPDDDMPATSTPFDVPLCAECVWIIENWSTPRAFALLAFRDAMNVESPEFWGVARTVHGEREVLPNEYADWFEEVTL